MELAARRVDPAPPVGWPIPASALPCHPADPFPGRRGRERRRRLRPDMVRSQAVHGGYTWCRQVGECNGHERSRPVLRNRRSGNQRSRYQAALQEAGQSSNLPTPDYGDLRPSEGGRWDPSASSSWRTVNPPVRSRLLPGCCPTTQRPATNVGGRVMRPGLTCGSLWWARQGLNL